MLRKKMLAAVLCLTAVFSMNVYGKDTANTVSEDEAAMIGMPNPFIDCEDMKEAEKTAGFSFSVPDSALGYKYQAITAMEDEMIQVIYYENEPSNDGEYSAETAEAGGELTLRKAKDDQSEDISGDYTEYSQKTTVTVDEQKVTMKGDNGKISCAAWSSGGYSYAILADKPMTLKEAKELVKALQ